MTVVPPEQRAATGEGKRRQNRRSAISQRRQEAVAKPIAILRGPRVRILLPPAASLLLAASVAIDLSDAKAISLMSVAVLLFSPMVVLALTNRFRLVPRLSKGITLLVKLSPL
jgi:hypothetical protein